MYTGEDGQQHTAENDNVQIDNASGQITSQGSTVSTLADIFTPFMTVPPACGQAIIAVTLTYRLTLITTSFVLAVPPTYVTDKVVTPPDKSNVVKTFDSGNPGATDLTAAEARDAINGVQAGLYAKLTPIKDPTWSYDCHGYTFTDGDKWINNNQVQKILNDNGYKEHAAGKVVVGDIVVYRKDGGITHSGIVTAVDKTGNATTIRSKWGELGLYDHAPGDVLPYYGTTTYYGTTRTGGNKLKKQ